MAAINYKEFGGGLDRRLPIEVQDANRLWTLQNAYISTGKKIVKRPGLRLVTDKLAGSVGLAAMNGVLNVFVEQGTAFTTPDGLASFTLTSYSGAAGGAA